MKSFSFSAESFDPAPLARELADARAGGFASFEGWVRNHNDGMTVTRLEYEAFEALALKEGERIVEEAQERFPIVKAACVHRVGALEVGELAVWVGVSAQHRDEAFRACRYIIDEVKHRVPIWKKEHYVNGDSGWVNCERCGERAGVRGPAPSPYVSGERAGVRGSAPSPHVSGERAGVRGSADYSRQTALKEIGLAGQAKLRSSRVLVVGAGGLGVPVLSYLGGAGVGTIGIVDGDVLEASNLHRQPLYTLRDVGKPKAELAAAHLRALNPDITVLTYRERFNAGNAPTLLADYDLAIDCTDNFASKFLLNDACVLAAKPAIFASVYQYEGQLQVYRPEDSETACLRCLWPEATQDGIVGNCAAAGVLGPVPGVLGSLQALEALKLLADLPGQLRGSILILDLATLAVRRLRAPRHAPCRSGRCVRISRLEETTSTDLELSFKSLERAAHEGFHVIDIRDDAEVATEPVSGAQHVPMARLLSHAGELTSGERYLLFCARGARSRAAAAALRARGFPLIYSLRGGAESLR